MKSSKFSKRKKILAAGLIIGVTFAAILAHDALKQASSFDGSSELVNLKPLSSQMMVTGTVISQNQESLHFQTGGKLVYLPFKEGDQVTKGQVIASLDSLEAQKGVTAAEANYRSAKAALDLVIDNIHLFQYGNGGFANVGSANETQTQKTQRQQAEEAVNVTYDNLQKAQKQLENTAIVAPFDGIMIHEDIKDVGVNITSTATFLLADLNNLVFQAQVSDRDIAYINMGDKMQMQLDGIPNKSFSGNVVKIYPEKIILSSGSDGYKVDIESTEINSSARFGNTGSVIFENKLASHAIVLPSWAILGNQYVWVMDQNTPKLKAVKVGETSGDKTQILEGLSEQDKVILNPSTVLQGKYQII